MDRCIQAWRIVFNYPKLFAYFGERAKGGVGLIITGGISPNRQGWLLPAGGTMNSLADIPHHRLVTHAVHKHGAKSDANPAFRSLWLSSIFGFFIPNSGPLILLNRVKCRMPRFWQLPLKIMPVVQVWQKGRL